MTIAKAVKSCQELVKYGCKKNCSGRCKCKKKQDSDVLNCVSAVVERGFSRKGFPFLFLMFWCKEHLSKMSYFHHNLHDCCDNGPDYLNLQTFQQLCNMTNAYLGKSCVHLLELPFLKNNENTVFSLNIPNTKKRLIFCLKIVLLCYVWYSVIPKS